MLAGRKNISTFAERSMIYTEWTNNSNKTDFSNKAFWNKNKDERAQKYKEKVK